MKVLCRGRWKTRPMEQMTRERYADTANYDGDDLDSGSPRPGRALYSSQSRADCHTHAGNIPRCRNRDSPVHTGLRHVTNAQPVIQCSWWNRGVGRSDEVHVRWSSPPNISSRQLRLPRATVAHTRPRANFVSVVTRAWHRRAQQQTHATSHLRRLGFRKSTRVAAVRAVARQ